VGLKFRSIVGPKFRFFVGPMLWFSVGTESRFFCCYKVLVSCCYKISAFCCNKVLIFCCYKVLFFCCYKVSTKARKKALQITKACVLFLRTLLQQVSDFVLKIKKFHTNLCRLTYFSNYPTQNVAVTQTFFTSWPAGPPSPSWRRAPFSYGSLFPYATTSSSRTDRDATSSTWARFNGLVECVVDECETGRFAATEICAEAEHEHNARCDFVGLG
jgi:hypothetical protein